MAGPFATEQKYLALGKEATRGTAVAASKYIAVDKGSEFDYKLNLIPDELVRGIFEVFPSKAGTKEGTGKISGMDVTANKIGELLYSLMGKEVVALQGSKTVLHTFSKDSTVLQNPSYTIHEQRGIGAKQYNMSVVKSIALKGTVDGKVTLDADVLFQKEATEAFTLTPVWEDPSPFMFFQTSIGFAETPDTTTVKDWSLTVDNGSVGQRVLNQSQDIKDIFTIGKQIITGTFSIYFDTEDRRNAFLAATSQAMTIIITGGLIETGESYTLTITIPHGTYTAFPFGDLDGYLGAAVTFNGEYNVATSSSLTIALQNTDTAYATAATLVNPTITSLDVATGTHTGGTSVTITGTGIVAGATVYVGGTIATSINVIGPTSISFHTPAGTVGTADVVLRNTDSGIAIDAGAFTYTT
jgi:hypothetical protein